MREPKPMKDPKIANRVHQTTKFEWARGTISIRAMIDEYPAGNFVTFFLRVGRHREQIGQTKSGRPIFAKAEVIEKSTYAMANSEGMMKRVEYFQSLPEKMEVTGEN